MAAPVILYIDTTNKRLISSFLSTIQPFQPQTYEAGDLVPMQLHFLTQNPASGTPNALPYAYIDPATVTPVSLAIGNIGAVPTAGTFTVTFGANTTSALAFNITSTALATSVNALASVISAGGVTITGNAGGPWTIVFNNTGAQTNLFAIGAGELVPVSLGITAKAVTGATGVQEVQVVTLVQSPAALQNTWTATYGAIVISRLQGGGTGLNEIQRITVPQGTYAGAYSIAFGAAGTASLAYNISASSLQTALAAVSTIGAGNVAVVQSSTVSWDVTFIGTLAGAAQSLMVGSSAGLQMPQYLSASLDLNVQGIFNLLTGLTSATPTMQVQQGTSGNINTVIQTTMNLQATLIRGTPSVPNPADPWQTLSEVNALIAAAAYVLPAATTTTLGGVIVPTAGHLSIDGSGNISVALATASVFGVVKPDGTIITVTAGVITVPAASSSAFGVVKVDGTTITSVAGVISSTGGGGGTGANPTAVVGLTAVNGSATTFLRSDGAPPISQSITPTWTGVHTFTQGLTTVGVAGTGNSVYQLNIIGQSGSLGGGYLQITNNTTGLGRFGTGGQLSLGVTNSPASTDLIMVNQSSTALTWFVNNSIGVVSLSSTLARHWTMVQFASELRVTTAFTATSNVTLANITGLTVNVAAAGNYRFRAVLFTTASASGGVQAAIAGTATATNIIYEGILYAAGAIVNQTRASALATAVGSSASATVGTIIIEGQITVNAAGTLTVQFAQNTSNASASTVLQGSTFQVFANGN